MRKVVTDLHPESEQRTILVVDDEITVRRSLMRILHTHGYRVLTAADGREALEVMSRARVDVLISDLDMPGMTGPELVLEARRLYPDVVRILLTGVDDGANAAEVDRYFRKTVKLDQLLSAVRHSLMQSI